MVIVKQLIRELYWMVCSALYYRAQKRKQKKSEAAKPKPKLIPWEVED